MKNFLLGVLVILVLGGVGLGSYLLGKRTTQQGPTPTTYVSKESFSPAPSPTTQAVSDNELIRQALYKKNNWSEGSVTVTVSTNDGKYASGTATANGGGGYFYAAKVNGVWEIVADGNGSILCSSLTKYPDYPKTLIPECYDQGTGKVVKR